MTGDFDETGGKQWMIPLGTVILLIGCGVLSRGMYGLAEEGAYINSLNGNNPYSKEYIYKQQDSTYVVVDSIYVKEETKN
jgi:hypothetical protein